METDKMSSVTAQEMRNQLSDLLNRAAYLKEPTLVTRQGKAVAVLVSVDDWEEYIRLKKASEEFADQADSHVPLEGEADDGAGSRGEEKI